MSKRKKQKTFENQVIDIGTDISPLPNHTTDYESYAEKTDAYKYYDKTTDEPLRTEPTLSRSGTEFLEKVLSGQVTFKPFFVNVILIIVTFVVLGWIFIQDNSAGMLNNLDGFVWLAKKWGMFVLLMTVFGAVINWFLKNDKN